jgi:hypothetical protein
MNIDEAEKDKVDPCLNIGSLTGCATNDIYGHSVFGGWDYSTMWSTSFKTPDDTSGHSTMHKDTVTTAKGGPMKCIANQVDAEGTGPKHFVQCDPAFNGSWMAFDNEDCDFHGTLFNSR